MHNRRRREGDDEASVSVNPHMSAAIGIWQFEQSMSAPASSTGSSPSVTTAVTTWWPRAGRTHRARRAHCLRQARVARRLARSAAFLLLDDRRVQSGLVVKVDRAVSEELGPAKPGTVHGGQEANDRAVWIGHIELPSTRPPIDEVAMRKSKLIAARRPESAAL